MGKQVRTPRFYVDMVSFLHATGQLGWDDQVSGRNSAELLYINPSNALLGGQLPDEPENQAQFSLGHYDRNLPKTSFPINFCALLNHNLASYGETFKLIGKYDGNSSTDLLPSDSNILNGDIASALSWNGTSIWEFTEQNQFWRSFEIYFTNVLDEGDIYQLGSFVVGKYWDAPNSPDLNLTMSRRFDGISRQKTIGGKTLANIYYDGATEWNMYNSGEYYKYPPFELDYPSSVSFDNEDSDNTERNVTFNQRAKSGLGRKGLRSWSLTFSYISEDDMWSAYESSSNAPFMDDAVNSETGSTPPTDNSISVHEYPNPMLSDDSFNFVWNCTLGGTLPFIFQPDNTNNNPDQFSICTFRENSLDVEQVAHNTYSLSITIDEVS